MNEGLLLTARFLSLPPSFSLLPKGYQFNRKKRVKYNSSFSAFHHLQRLSVLVAAAPLPPLHASRLSVWSNPGRAPGYLSGKYLQATVQKPNLVCGRLILSYYIPSVDSSGLGPLSPSLSTLFQAHFLLSVSFSPPPAAVVAAATSPASPPLSSLLRSHPTIPVNCPKLFDRPRKHVFQELRPVLLTRAHGSFS